jgi:tetratricopeptide (TPR) repeat protein
MFIPRRVYPQLVSTLFVFALCLAVSVVSGAQASKPAPVTDFSSSAQHAIDLTESGHCREALPLLRKATPHVGDKELQRKAGFAGVRCAMFLNESDAAVDFLRLLDRQFPHDPDVLLLAVHTYSDLSTRASLELASTAPASYQAHELNAESLEVQGKWDEAAQEYRQILKQNPRLPGIHYRLGRILVSKPNFGPEAAAEAKNEFEREIEIDPSNAGAEDVLGELCRQAEQWDDAIKHFSRAVKLDAGFGDALLGLGSSLISVKKFAEAIPPLERAVKLEPQNPTGHYQLAVAYSRTGRKPEADREFALHRKMAEANEAGQGSQPGPPPEKPN